MNQEKNQDKVIPLQLRIEPELKVEAVKHAKQSRQSLNSWILSAVEQRISRDQENAA